MWIRVAYRYILFWIASTRALIFHMNIPCDKTFHYFLINIRAFILHMIIPCEMSSYWYEDNCPCDLDHLWNWPLSGHLCVTNTSCFLWLWYIKLKESLLSHFFRWKPHLQFAAESFWVKVTTARRSTIELRLYYKW